MECNGYKESCLSDCAISNQETCMFFDNLSSRPGVCELSKSSITGLFANTEHNGYVELHFFTSVYC